MEIIIIISIIVAVLALSAYFWKGNAPKPYNTRSYTDKKWRNKFPNVSKEIIREFLECFVDGVAFNSNERLKFEPLDKVMKAYQAIFYNGETPLVDAIELETFYLNLEKSFLVGLVLSLCVVKS